MITDRLYARDVTEQDILDLIATKQRELNDLEYKLAADADLLKAACGIANAGGGFILIGMDEDAKHQASGVVHIENSGNVVESVRQRARDGLSPRPVIEVVPLTVETADIVVARISPQNPPHMVSQDKRSDFYGRYDATTERMRYEEIEQRFRDKFETGQIVAPETPVSFVETIGGRVSVSLGAKTALESYVERTRAAEEPALAIIAVSEGGTNAVTEERAFQLFEEPLYSRKAGWVVAHPSLEVSRENGIWIQRYGPASTTTVNPSADLIFLKPVDDVLCWRQDQKDFERSPRIYPNALLEYCLSFAYLIADAAATTLPRGILLTAVMANAAGVRLPLGEGGSVWFDTPLEPPKALNSDFVVSPVIEISGRSTVYSRHLAYNLAAQIYSFFGYLEKQIAFASEGEIIVESDPSIATLTSLRAFFQGAVHLRFGPPYRDHSRGSFWFNTVVKAKDYRLGVSDEFVYDHAWTESKLFKLLETLDLPSAIEKFAPDRAIMLTDDGLKLVPYTN